MSRLEDDLRVTLRQQAMNVDLSGGLPPEVHRRARLRRAGTAGLTGVLALAAVAVTVGVVRSVHPAPAPQPAPTSWLPLVERVPVRPHSNGDLVYPVNGSLVRRAPDGGTSTWVTRRAMDEACGSRDCSIGALDWSPDGSQLAVVMGVIRRTTASSVALYVVDDGSATPRKVFDCAGSGCAYLASLTWSPDGSAIAIAGTGTAGAGIGIAEVADPATAPRPVCTECRAGSVAWSPDGRWFAYTSPDGIRRIATSGGPSELVDPLTNVSSLSWSPDGTRLLIETSTAVRTVDLSRRPYTESTVVAGMTPSEGPAAPSWSPDGRRVAWFSTPGKHRHFVAEVWTAAPDGSAPHRLMRSGCCVSDWAAPMWSPDGKSIALGLATDPTAPTDLIILDAVRGGQITRAVGQGWGAMAWQPKPGNG